MIKKPVESDAYLSLKIGLVAALATCVAGSYFFYWVDYVATTGQAMPVQFHYIKSCINPFQQDICNKIKQVMSQETEQTFETAITVVGGLAFVTVLLLFWSFWDGVFRRRPVIIKAGLTVASLDELKQASAKEIKNSSPGIKWFSGFQLSKIREVSHFLVFGAIGGGKTVAIMPLLHSVMERGDKAIVFDFKGDYTTTCFSKPKGTDNYIRPIILAPHDERSAIWDIAKDLRIEADAIEVANRIIPQSNERFFSDSARSVLALCIIYLMRTRPNAWTWADLLETTSFGAPKLLELAATHHRDALAYLQADYRQVSATISTMTAGLGAVRMLAYGWKDVEGKTPKKRFSLNEWLLDEENPDRTIILQRSGRFQDQSEGWISAFLSVLSSNVSDVSFGESKNRRVWFFGDEFAQLPKVNRFQSLLETGRSKGFACVLGIQGMEQMIEKYSQAVADTIESIIGTKIIARINVGQTSKRLEEQFGETLFVSNREESNGRGGLKWTRSDKREPVFQRSEFQTELGPLINKRGVFVLVTGIGKHLYKVLVPYKKYKHRRDAEIPAAWTQELQPVDLKNLHETNKPQEEEQQEPPAHVMEGFNEGPELENREQQTWEVGR